MKGDPREYGPLKVRVHSFRTMWPIRCRAAIEWLRGRRICGHCGLRVWRFKASTSNGIHHWLTCQRCYALGNHRKVGFGNPAPYFARPLA